MTMVTNIASALKDEILVGEAVGWPLFLNVLPDTPDQCVALFASAGEPPFGRDPMMRRPGLQVRARAPMGGAEAAEVKVDEIRRFLVALCPTTLNGTAYREVLEDQDAFVLGDDQSGRPSVVQNFIVWEAE